MYLMLWGTICTVQSPWKCLVRKQLLFLETEKKSLKEVISQLCNAVSICNARRNHIYSYKLICFCYFLPKVYIYVNYRLKKHTLQHTFAYRY